MTPTNSTSHGEALNRQSSIATLPGVGQPGLTTLDILERVPADVLFEATRVNLDTGEPGMSAMRSALSHGMNLITTNKGPLALAYAELSALAKANGAQIRHCGTVMGGLPVISIAERDLAGTVIERIEAQANLATSYILARMGEQMSYPDAVQDRQRSGLLRRERIAGCRRLGRGD